MRIKTYADDKNEEPSLKDKEKRKLRFIRNTKFSDLYTKTENDCIAWLAKLGSVMIRTDFHQRFEVKQVLGQGGFAKVYLGKSLVDGEHYAIKAFKKEEMKAQKRGRAAVKNEVDVLQNLRHPNLMRMFEVHETANSLYLICEYLDGGSLIQHLQSAVTFLSADEMLTILMYCLVTQRCLKRHRLHELSRLRPPRHQA